MKRPVHHGLDVIPRRHTWCPHAGARYGSTPITACTGCVCSNAQAFTTYHKITYIGQQQCFSTVLQPCPSQYFSQWRWQVLSSTHAVVLPTFCGHSCSMAPSSSHPSSYTRHVGRAALLIYCTASHDTVYISTTHPGAHTVGPLCRSTCDREPCTQHPPLATGWAVVHRPFHRPQGGPFCSVGRAPLPCCSGWLLVACVAAVFVAADWERAFVTFIALPASARNAFLGGAFCWGRRGRSRGWRETMGMWMVPWMHTQW